MRGFFNLAVATAAAFVSQTIAAPIVVTPGDKGDIIITADNTVNATAPLDQQSTLSAQASPLTISFVNNFGDSQLNVYVTGHDTSGAVVMLGGDGAWYYPDPAGSASPVEITADVAHAMSGKGQTTDITIPDYLVSGRVWVSEGTLTFYTVVDGNGSPSLVEPAVANPSDPSVTVNWGFVEFTNTEEGGIYANLSFVDFAGLVMGMELALSSGETQKVEGLQQDAISTICDELKTQASSDGQPWDKLCVTNSDGTPLRILSPNIYASIDATAFSGYYDDYINQVWDKYTNEDLTINTQTDAGNVACRVSGDELTCENDNRGYPKPTVIDIWGCNSGPFAIQGTDNAVHSAVVPRLCSAFYRTTLLLDGGDLQPGLNSSNYYLSDPTCHYSRLLHKYESDGKGYTYSYDDVNPDGENAAGVVTGLNPTTVTLTVGGYSS
ncbi:glycoside hydrolase family 64 protein [Hypoxylon sp. CI-4A]|nr:glycoside hydrolase family 64 protein [Hypoxylon sp. CI-4A]